MKLHDILLESDETVLGQEFKAALDQEMEDGKLDEALTAIGILGWALASNTVLDIFCLLYTSPSPRDGLLSRMPSSA